MQRGAGGTPGGLWEFFIGAAMVVVGSILFMQRLMVSSTISALVMMSIGAMVLRRLVKPRAIA